MKILHFSNKPVYPKVDGGCAAMASLLKCLELTGNDIHHICISTEKHPFSKKNYPDGISIPLTADVLFVPVKVTAAGALSSLLKGKNYNLSRFWSENLAASLKKMLLSEKYDIIVLDSAFLVSYIDFIKSVLPAAFVIVRTHNVEFLLWEQQAKLSGFLKAIYLKMLSRTLKKEELEGLNKADLIWSISNEDSEKLVKNGVATKIELIPFAVERGSNKVDYSNADFMHFGSMNWHPNKESLTYLLQNIWPKVSRGTKLHIAGSFTDDSIKTSENVIRHGFVEDPEEFLQSNGTLLAPLKSGSGVRIKLLESMAAGVPCVTTKTGAAGIESPENYLAIAESDDDWLEVIEKLKESVDERKALGRKGQAYVANSHSFEIVTEKIAGSLVR